MKDLIANSEGKNIVSWVSPEWLADHLDDPRLTVIDCRQQSHAYIHEHIPGAIYVHEGLLRMHIGRSPVQWIPAEAAQVLFANLGIEQDHPVVVYSEGTLPKLSAAALSDGLEQTFLAYTTRLPIPPGLPVLVPARSMYRSGFLSVMMNAGK
jgi:thiosulfate/3-mercaptopyruvate sulfurtransferase